MSEELIPSSEIAPTLELLDPITILITNLPKQLLQKEVQTYQLLPSYWHNHGYAARLKMLNSLKRHASQIGIKLPDLGNLSFRMFKSSQVRGPGSTGGKNPEYNQNSEKNSKYRNLNNKVYSSKQNNNSQVSGKYQIMHIGRWFLTPHQKRGVNYFMRKGKRMILGDGWNMGKTVTSLACMKYSKSKKVLIMTNKILVSHWLWHVHQLLNSFSKSKANIKIVLEEPLKKQLNTNKDCDTITIQILDYPQYSKNTSSPYRYKAKEQRTKLQQKIIKQEHSLTGNLHFTICSYEYMSNLVQQGIFSSCSSATQIGFDVKSYHGVIIDDLPNDIVSGEIDESHYLMKISKIENLIICKDIAIEDTLHYLPLLNSKLKWKQLNDRYIGPKQKLVNLNQYVSSLTKNYFYQTKETSCCPPGPLIKPILLTDSSQNRSRQKQPYDTIFKSCFAKISPACSYFDQIISENKSIKLSPKKQIDIFVILEDHDYRQKFIQECKQKCGISIRNLSDDSDFDDCLQKIGLTVGRIQEILKILKVRKNKKCQKFSTKIILMQAKRKDDSRFNFYQNKINELYGYGRLQYIELCSEDPKTGQLKKIFFQGRKPSVTTYSFINQIISQGEYVSSDEQKQKPLPVNPQRYFDTGSDDQDLELKIKRDENDVSNIMIDENSEIELEKRIGMSINIDEVEQIEIQSRDKIIQLPNLLVGKGRKQENKNDSFEILIDSDSEMIDEKCYEMIQHEHINQVNTNELVIPTLTEDVASENGTQVKNNQIQQVLETENAHQIIKPSQEISKRHGRKKLIKKPLQQQSFQNETNKKNIFKRETRQSTRKNEKIDQAIAHDVIKSKPLKVTRRKVQRNQTSSLSNLQNTLTQQKSHSLLMQSVEKVVLESMNMYLNEPQTEEKQIFEISSDDEEKTLVSVRPKKAKSKQVLSVKLVPNRSFLNYCNF